MFFKIFKAFGRTEKLFFLGFAAVFLASGGLLIWFSVEKNVSRIPVSGGEYREGAIGQPIYVNPVLANENGVDQDLIALVYANLFDLSKNRELEADQRSYLISLRDDILWSDGERITSDDVIFTLKLIQDSSAHSPLFQTWQGVVAERISELQIRFVLPDPYVFFEKNLSRLVVVPKHIFGSIPPANLRLSVYNLEPVGSGPYKFSGYDKQRDGFITDYRLETSKNYFGKKPFIVGFAFKFYQDEAGLVEAFNSRAIDGFGGIDPEKLNSLSLNKKVFEMIMPRYYAVFFNQSVSETLKEKDTRMALMEAVDKKKIINEVFGGSAIESNGPLLAGFEGYDADSETAVDYAPEKARERTASLAAKKLSLELSLVVPHVPFLVKTANLLKQYWEEAGFKINLLILSPTDVAGEVIRTRNYEMLLFGASIANNPDIFSFWHSSERFYPGLNFSLYNNRKTDELLELARQTSDTAKQLDYLKDIQKLISSELPALFLYSPKYLYVSAPMLDGVETDGLNFPSERFNKVEEWFEKTAKVL
ncbi:MAG: ABC transporter substrate-binding protein [Patescibacteria group bacterium]